MEHQHTVTIRFHRARRGRTLAAVRIVSPNLVRWQRFMLPVSPAQVEACRLVVDGLLRSLSQRG
jgi:hypothetical protein